MAEHNQLCLFRKREVIARKIIKDGESEQNKAKNSYQETLVNLEISPVKTCSIKQPAI